MDFDRTEPLPDVEDIDYVEYYFDSFDGYMLTILIDIDDYVEILELACQDNSYEYYGSTYEGDGSVSIDLHVYTETNDVCVLFARKYSEELGGYYTLNSDIFSTIYSILEPYRTQAMEEYAANNE